MSADGIGQNRGIPFSPHANDCSPLLKEQKAGKEEEMQKINDIADRNLQITLPESEKQEERSIPSLHSLENFSDPKISAERARAQTQFTLAMMYFE